MDNLTPAQRIKNMQNIRSKNTQPEVLIARELRKRKIYFAQHVRTIPGTPDFVFRRKRVIVFVDSDFWHCNPKRFIMPKSNIAYWKTKIACNKARDKKVNSILRKSGLKVIRIWESDLKKELSNALKSILTSINMEHLL